MKALLIPLAIALILYNYTQYSTEKPESESSGTSRKRPMPKVAIVGGSLAGLSAATVLLRLGFNVTVFEREMKPLYDRGSSLGFVDNALWEEVKQGMMIRRGVQANRYQGAYYYGDLWNFWYKDLPEGIVKFGRTITDLGDDPMKPTIDGEVYDFAILADGGWSSLRKKYITQKEPEYSGILMHRLKVNMKDFPDFHSERSMSYGKVFSIALVVAMDKGEDWIMGGFNIPYPEHAVQRPEGAVNRQANWQDVHKMPPWFLPFARDTLARHPQIVKWIELAVNGPGKITAQPLFEFGADKVRNGRIIMIGDAAHMASPSTAGGAHTGILDSKGIRDAFTRFNRPEDIDRALDMYEEGGFARARNLYLRSKSLTTPLAYKPGDEHIYEKFA